MLNKGMAVLVITALLLSFGYIPEVQAFSGEPGFQQILTPSKTFSPMYTYIITTETGLTISASGTATVTGLLIGYSDVTDNVQIYLYLQQYKNGTWTTINSWYEIFDSYWGAIERTSSVSSGYQYRVKASYYAYSGSTYENVTQYSQTITY